MTALLWLAKLPAPIRGLLGLLLVFGLGAAGLAAYGAHERGVGRAMQRASRAEAEAAHWKGEAARRDSVQVRVDTVLAAARPRYAARRDTALAHPHDSAAVVAALTTADTVIAVCQLARLTCEERVAARDSIIAALRTSIAAETQLGRPSFVRRAATSLLWLGAGYAAGRLSPR